jgi:alpha-1,2-mannosyltransferase
MTGPRAEAVRRLVATPSPVKVALLIGLSLLGYCVFRLVLVPPSFTDLWVYRAEGSAFRDGSDLYGPLQGVHGVNTYPPFAALVFVSTTFVPIAGLKVLSVVGNLILVFVVSWQSVQLARGRGSRNALAVCILAAVALWSEPVATTISYGQNNLVLLALVLWDFNLPTDSSLRGIGVGLAAAIKVTPGILIVYLVLTRRFRAAATAMATVLTTIAVTALLDAEATWNYWTSHLFDFGRSGRLENSVNQSVRGWLVRAEHTRDTRPSELLLALLVLLTGLTGAVLAQRYLGDRWGLLAAGVTGLLISPISWSHHWVWCIPIFALLWYEARVFALATVALFCSGVIWAVPHGDAVELHLTDVQTAVSGLYVVFGLAFLALTAWRIRAARSALGRETRADPGYSPEAT